MSQVSKVDEILQKVFQGGVGFERGQSMFEQGHFKMTQKEAKQALLSIILEALPEKVKATHLINNIYVAPTGEDAGYNRSIDDSVAAIKKVFGVEA